MQTVPKVAQFDTCMSGHCTYYTFKPEMKQILGNTSIGWTRRVSPQGVDQKPPRGDADGINKKINTISTQVSNIKVIQVFCATVSIV